MIILHCAITIDIYFSFYSLLIVTSFIFVLHSMKLFNEVVIVIILLSSSSSLLLYYYDKYHAFKIDIRLPHFKRIVK